jgi:hypothetical protein
VYVATDDQLYEKVLRSHNEILSKVDSFDVRLELFEKDIISFPDYNTYFVDVNPQTFDRRALCESMMYLLCKCPQKVNANLQHFIRFLRSHGNKYADVVDHISSVDISKHCHFTLHTLKT